MMSVMYIFHSILDLCQNIRTTPRIIAGVHIYRYILYRISRVNVFDLNLTAIACILSIACVRTSFKTIRSTTVLALRNISNMLSYTVYIYIYKNVSLRVLRGKRNNVWRLLALIKLQHFGWSGGFGSVQIYIIVDQYRD